MLPDYIQRTVLTNDVRQTMMTTCQSADSDIGVLSETCYRLLRSWPRNWLQVSSHQRCITAAISAAKPPASCSNAHVRSPRRGQSCRRFAAWRSRQSHTRDLPEAVAGQNAVLAYIPPTSCMAVGGGRHGTTRGQRHRVCHTEHRLRVLHLLDQEIARDHARDHALRSQGHARPGWQSIAPIQGATIGRIWSANPAPRLCQISSN